MNDNLRLNVSTNFNLVNNNEEDVTLVLSEATQTNTGSVNGTVFETSIETGTPISGATVKVFTESGVPYMHTVTDEKGNYSINDLPVGIYKIAAVKNGYYLTNMMQITISDILPININLAIEKEIIKNIIYGKITDSNTNEPIGNVNILLYQTIDGVKTLISNTKSINDGEYVLDAILDGTYELAFEKQGYITSQVNTIIVANNKIMKVDIILESAIGNINSTVSGIIKNELGIAVSNAFVGLYKLVDGQETLVATTYTNNEGKYMFGNVIEENYMVKSKLTNKI